MNRIRKSRLSIVVYIALLGVWLGFTGLWKDVVALPRTVDHAIYDAEYDRYAKSIGKTTYQLEQEFYQRQVDANAKAHAAGQHECTWFSRGDCYRRPRRGRWAIERDTTTSDVLEGVRRAARKSVPLLYPLLGSLLGALFLVYALPAVLRRFWRWLAP